MTDAERGLLDTSVLISQETGRVLLQDLIPAEAAISVITLAELEAGVLAAGDLNARARRMRTVDAMADIVILPIDESVAREWARLRVYLAETGRRVRVNDLWIAATAAAHSIPIVSQDADFDAVADAPGVSVIRV